MSLHMNEAHIFIIWMMTLLFLEHGYHYQSACELQNPDIYDSFMIVKHLVEVNDVGFEAY